MGEATIEEWDRYVREMTDSEPYKAMMAKWNELPGTKPGGKEPS
ncbi:hypothetical protein [Paenibacillus flagellatus]|nr:hypothetical protein [Paenibacillus flagellatus]